MKKMTKSTKLILCVIAATLLLCAVIIAVSVGLKHGKQQPTEPSSDPDFTTPISISDFFDIDDPVEDTQTTTLGPALSQQLLGKWTDSAGMSGYEFFEGGRVTVTYFNLTIPILNLPLSGTTDGSYTLSGDTLSVTFSIYSKVISYVYTATVEDNRLTLTDHSDGKQSVYMRGTPDMASEIPNGTSIDDELTGTWGSSDATARYQFDGNGVVLMAFAKAELPEVSDKPVSGSFTGIYMTDADKLTIQFLNDGERATQTYLYRVSTKTLSLTDNRGNTILFLRDGIGALPENTSRAEDLLGKWRDGTGSNGFRFMDGGLVEITYVDIKLPVVNIPINGSFRGTYEVEGDKLTLRYSIYTHSVTENYTFSVSGSALTLTNLENGNVSTYTKS